MISLIFGFSPACHGCRLLGGHILQGIDKEVFPDAQRYQRHFSFIDNGSNTISTREAFCRRLNKNK